MRAVVIERPGHVGLGARAEPTLAPDDVLVRVRTVGFCGSDLSTFRGLNPLVAYPRVPGHEIAGVVAALGSEVPAGLHPGTLVTVVPYTACGACPACRRGRVNTCRDNRTLGVQRDGAMTELIAVPWQKVLPADGLSRRELALVEPLAVGAHAAARGRVAPGDVVAVLGTGAVGLGAVAAAARAGGTVIAVDVDERKLAVARRAGAAHAVNSRATPLHDALRELTRGDGPDVIIEAVGHPDTFLAAVAEVAVAGRVIYIGYAKGPVSFDTTQFVRKELDVLGARNATADDFRAVVALLREGSFPVADAVTRVVPLAAAADALRAWDADPGAVTRIHVDLD
ncbi:Alcohol dehydrogenase zinc-binding domain protein (plasmid) [Gemmatirosa kalamazoonensis]|uniref:Alcohol dehydrogenase zinc-binding domain protein n=1 Tax=Gemmatirosa kalamazoonensis TaxID=861299 RepID=W0RSL6_9BACT|nr:alcohol dehydrogenase catalytic domain-containing protein [Gemmatirosa kalamazoonensis]AHG93295.1 Alcohol dehydrogenase zinc-binding domain protein [Gemmatirosa kalamazoonensis]